MRDLAHGRDRFWYFAVRYREVPVYIIFRILILFIYCYLCSSFYSTLFTFPSAFFVCPLSLLNICNRYFSVNLQLEDEKQGGKQSRGSLLLRDLSRLAYRIA